ncbi:MAG: aminoacetone oxidase family FAD-binding enzyme [SAR86 cluster bacterium]|uniref:Aminoacetone oxidase family FAD-binding enzyme n=1 Tax=SAR86 cluster bacterium TaxID=2030880 RepID=A0A2A5AP02_9GAMM|nr:MAG: aminoacetone oxidase family FAD-binding enzyme [SAR86 cluster bacterium]
MAQFNKKKYDVIVLGAGAAGLMCAFTAAQRGLSVLVLEKANKVGKKILMSGGGRCNFTNRDVSAGNFISANPHFCKSALSQYTQWDFISMVEQHGIEYEERKHGQLFCLHTANDILSMLLHECELAGVEIKTHCSVASVKEISETEKSRYRISINTENTQSNKTSSVDCHSLVIATGALSVPTLGGSDIGYTIAEQFGLSLIPRRAGLAPFMFSDSMKSLCERLSGSSLEVEVTCNGTQFNEDMLFTHRGLSGPVMLQISNYWFPGDEIEINLLPTVDVQQWIIESKQQQTKSQLKNVLNQRLPKSLVLELEKLWWANHSDTPMAEFSDKQLLAIADRLENWKLKPSATEGYRTAEVTLGGVNTDNISSKTMETKGQSGLFFIGEVLDVTGHLGGFNFQWAWSSGFCAGQNVSL